MNDDQPRATDRLTLSEFTRRVLVVVAVAGLAVALWTVFVRASGVFFLFFAAILLAILLRAATDAVSRWTGLGKGWALAVVVLLLLGMLGGGLYLCGSTLVAQVNALIDDLPKSADQARKYVKSYAWGAQALRWLPKAEDMAANRLGGFASRAAGLFTGTLGVLGNLLVLAFLGLYLALSPTVYVDGAVRLVAPPHRDRARQVLYAIGAHLKWWMGGRLVAIAAVGLVTGIGLWLIGVPQYLILALLAAVLSSIPYIGPIAAAFPGVLLALVQGPSVAGWAVVVYLVAQGIENYLVTPLVQQKTVEMPPVVTILAVVLVGSLAGVLGLIVATPLAVAVQVAVKMLYVEDVLGDDMHVAGASVPK